MPTKEQSEEKGPSPALQAFYAKYTEQEVTTCEAARTAYGTLLPKLKEAHKVFAGKGREGQFKKWCELAGVNYNSARAMISRDKRGSANKANTSGQGKQAKWTAEFNDPAKQKRWYQGVERVIKAYNLQRGDALLFILDVFEEHWEKEKPLPATDAAQPSPAKAKANGKVAKTEVAA